ncbi:MAG: hypothetical protein HOW73_44985 [Polyangiaceae bacterium]|nr:hypothetical protein [Polyangiaceae bacterium]
MRRKRTLSFGVVALLSIPSFSLAAPTKEQRAQLEVDRARAMRAADEDGRAGARAYLEHLKDGLDTEDESAIVGAAAALDELAGLHCPSSLGKEAPDFCAPLSKISCDVKRLAAERSLRRADKAQSDEEKAEAPTHYERAARLYLSLAPNEACGRTAELYYNASHALRAARKLGPAVQALEQLLKVGGDAKLEALSLHELGGIFQAVGEYDRSASYYERFAARFPTDAEAPSALLDATVLRLGLSQRTSAEKNADLFLKVYGAKRREEAARVSFALAADAMEKESADPAVVKRSLDRATKTMDALALPYRLQLHVLVARDARTRGKTNDARAELVKVRGAEKALSTTGRGADSEMAMRELGKGLSAVGEATFLLARMDDQSAKRPALAAPKKGSALDSWVQGSLSKWLDERNKGEDAIEKTYASILDIQPAPPPRWVVEGAAEVARIRIDVVRDLMKTRVDIARALGNEQAAAFDAAMEPSIARAEAAARKYFDLSAKLEWRGERHVMIERWFARRSKKPFHQVVEMFAPPGFVPGMSLAPPDPVRK